MTQKEMDRQKLEEKDLAEEKELEVVAGGIAKVAVCDCDASASFCGADCSECATC